MAVGTCKDAGTGAHKDVPINESPGFVPIKSQELHYPVTRSTVTKLSNGSKAEGVTLQPKIA